jgi:hypothetical protein
MYITVNKCTYNIMCTYSRYHSDGNPSRISILVIGVVRTLGEVYNVRCSVRTVLVRSRNSTPTPEEILPLRLKKNRENKLKK